MGEEAKKPEEEKKAEDEKPKAEEPPKAAEEPKKECGEEKPAGDAPTAEAEAPPPPPPPEEIEMRVFMHCEGCARKVKRCLKGFNGVEDVMADCRTHKVVVKGKKAAEDPLKVVDRVQKKTGRKVELLTPLPPPPPPPPKEEEKKEEEKPKVEEKKEEPVVIAVVLKVHMHCEACAQEIKKRILKMKGVQAAEPELKASQVTVKGVFEPAKLAEYVYKRAGKHAAIVKIEPEKKPDNEEAKEEEKPMDDKKAEEKAEGEKAEKEGGGGGDEKEKKEVATGEAAALAAAGGVVKVEQKRNEFYYYYPRYPVEYAYPPQMFSDENPNACSVM